MADNNKVDITPENMLDHPDTPSDMLEGFVQPKLEDIDTNSEDIESASRHANATPTMLQNIYNAAFPQTPDAKPGSERVDHHGIIESVLSHKNVPASVAEDFLKRTHANAHSDDYASTGIKEAASHPGVSHDLLQSLTDAYINSNDEREGKSGNYGEFRLKPEYYMNLIGSRGFPEPVNRSMTEAQKAKNRRIKKIDDIAFRGLANTHRHTPQTLDQTVNVLTSDRPIQGLAAGTKTKAIHDLINNQEGLSEGHLERLWQTKDEEGKPDFSVREAIVNHRNVSPALVGKAALMDAKDYSDRSLKEAALKSPKLPAQTRNQFIENADPENDSSMVREYLQNPTLRKEDVARLYKKGFTDETIGSEHLPKELIRDFVDTKADKASSAREVLKREDLDSGMLQKLVAHKNQDVAIEALDHPNADMAVVNAALKRKAPKVQNAAARHPAVAKTLMRERFNSGKMSAYDLLFDQENRKAFGDLTPDDIKKIHDEHSITNMDDQAKHDNDDRFWRVKSWLSTADEVPSDLQTKNRRDIVNYYLHKDAANPGDDSGSIEARLRNGVHQLAQKYSDPAARNALLKRPHDLNSVDFKAEDMDDSYLRQAYKALKNASSSGKDGFFESSAHKSYSNILRNSNTPEDVFTDIIAQPNFLENKNHYLLDDRYSHRADKSPFATVFDRRWGTLDEAQKRQKFAQLAEQPGGHEAIIESKTAPKEMWRESFDAIDPAKRNSFLEDHDLSSYADPTVRQRALLGEFKTPEAFGYDFGYDSEHKPQLDILKSLDPKKAEHQSELDHFIEYGLDQPNRASNTGIVNALDPKFFAGPKGKEVLAKLFAKDGSLGVHAAIRSLANLDDKEDDYRGDYEAKTRKANIARVGALKEALAAGVDTSDPTVQEHEMKHRWMDALRADSSTLSSLIGSRHHANGNLDFLMDRSDDSDMNRQIKETAVRQGLISNARIAKEALKNHDYLDAYMQSAEDSQKSRYIRDLVDANGVNEKNFQTILNHLTNQTFTPKLTRDEYLRGDYQKALDYTNKLVQHFLTTDEQHGKDLAPQRIALILQKITSSNSRDRGAMTKPFKRELIKDVVAGIENSAIDPSLKSQTLYSVWNTLEQNENEAMPANLGKQIVKAARESGDIPTLMSILESGRDVGTGINDIIRMVDQPDQLDDRALGALVGASDSDKVSANSVKKILQAVTERAIQNPQSAHELVARASTSMSQALKRLKFDYTDHPELVKKAKIGAEFLKNAAASGNGRAQDHIATLLNHSELTNDLKADMYKSLPDQIAGDIDPEEFNTMVLNRGLSNHPDVVRSSLHGWKLKALARSAQYLDKDNSSVVTERVMNSPELSAGDKLQYATKLTRNLEASPEDVVKMARSLGPNGPFDVARQFQEGGKLSEYHRADDSHLDALVPIMTGDIHLASRSHDPNAYSADHLKDLHYKVKTVADTLGTLGKVNDLNKKEDNAPVSPREEEVARGRRNLLDSFKHIHSQAMQKISQGSYPGEIAQGQINTSQHIVDALTRGGSIDKESTLDLFDLLNYPEQVQAAHNEATGLNKEFDVSHRRSERLNKLVANGEFSEDSFKEALKKNPYIPWAMRDRGSVDPYMLDAFNVNQILESESEGKGLYTLSHILNKVNKQGGREAAGRLMKTAEEYVLRNPTEDNQNGYQQLVISGVSNFPEMYSTSSIRALKQIIKDSHRYADIVDSAIRHGAGGHELLTDAINDQFRESESGNPVNKALLQTAARSPNITPDAEEKILKIIDNESEKHKDLDETAYEMASNKKLSTGAVSGLLRLFDKHHDAPKTNDAKRFVQDILEQPNISREDFRNLYANTSQNLFKRGVHPALWNPRFGGELLRSDPRFNEAPSDVPNVETDKLAKSADASKGRERLNKLLAVLPAQGMQWIDFKRANKSMENLPEVKELFMRSKGNFVRPEDVVDAMREAHDPFHLTYTKWEGAQRHMGDEIPNLVMQANLSHKMEQKLAADPKRWEFYKKIAEYDRHPNTPRIAGWARVDTRSGKKGWIIEELQSDFGPALDRQIRDIFKAGEDFEVGGEKLKQDEALRYSKEIADIMNGWHESLMSAVEESAKNHGVKALYLHGPKVRGGLSGFDADREAPVRFNEMYQKWPSKNGWENVDYGDYPNYNEGLWSELEQDSLDGNWRKKLKT